MKKFYCSNCGVSLEVRNKAIKGIDTFRVVAPHSCREDKEGEGWSDLPDIPPITIKKDDKFVQKLNELSPNKGTIFDDEIGDKRDEPIIENRTTTAPISISEQISRMQNEGSEG